MRQRQKRLILAFMLAVLIFITACASRASQELTEEASIEESSDVNSVSTEVLPEETAPEDNPFFFTENGTRAIRFSSVDLVAYGPTPPADPTESTEPKFGLVPTYEEFPASNKRTVNGAFIYDWQDYAHRLEKAHYALRINRALEPQLNEIIIWLLNCDDVIPDIYIIGTPVRIEWKNPEILEDFIQNNCTVTYFDCDYSPEAPSENIPENAVWRVYQGGCFADFSCEFSEDQNEDICGVHDFYVMLIDFSGEERVFYDIKHIREAGCGATLPWAEMDP